MLSYIAIDLKSFYASAECAARGLDPLTTHLVVADESRTEKTICLAVSPSLKALGIGGRARLFEVNQKLEQVNRLRAKAAGGTLTGDSSNAEELRLHPEYAVKTIIAPPRMARYMQLSTRIYGIYTRYVAPEDIVVYSIDEVFIHAEPYLKMYQTDARGLAMRMIRDVLKETGITATAGLGENLYLCKVAMDIVAKHCEPDADGVRIAELTEQSYREQLWEHRPLTDFWRVGRGIARKLQANGMLCMGDVALMSLKDEDLLFELFGVNAELLIDHAWGWEPCRVSDIRAYKPESSSLSSGQVLSMPYPHDRATVIVREMAEELALALLEKQLVTDRVELVVCYDIENMTRPEIAYTGPVQADHYGRKAPKPAHGFENLPYTASARQITDAMLRIFERVTDKRLLVRRVYVIACRLQDAAQAPAEAAVTEQMDMFTDYAALEAERAQEKARLEREQRAQNALLQIRHRFGKNALLKGTSLQKGATGRERHRQIGGHRAETDE